MYCPNCGEQYSPGSSYCIKCGTKLANTESTVAVPQKKWISGMAIASIVLGIFSVVMGILDFYFSLLGILAIIFGVIVLVRTGRDQSLRYRVMAIIGMVLGVIPLLIWAISIVLLFLGGESV